MYQDGRPELSQKSTQGSTEKRSRDSNRADPLEDKCSAPLSHLRMAGLLLRNRIPCSPSLFMDQQGSTLEQLLGQTVVQGMARLVGHNVPLQSAAQEAEIS